MQYKGKKLDNHDEAVSQTYIC